MSIRVTKLALGTILVSAPVQERSTGLAEEVALTSAEREVVQLALRGASNAAIGTARGCARRTVANQLATAYVKLGIGSRRELRALLRRQG